MSNDKLFVFSETEDGGIFAGYVDDRSGTRVAISNKVPYYAYSMNSIALSTGGRTFALLGLGLGSQAFNLYHRLKASNIEPYIVGVESDSDMLAYFAIVHRDIPRKLKVVRSTAEDWANRPCTDEKYDAILIDLFKYGLGMHRLSFNHYDALLSKSKILIFNTIKASDVEYLINYAMSREYVVSIEAEVFGFYKRDYHKHVSFSPSNKVVVITKDTKIKNDSGYERPIYQLLDGEFIIIGNKELGNSIYDFDGSWYAYHSDNGFYPLNLITLNL